MPVNRLKTVDLPAFGLPATAIRRVLLASKVALSSVGRREAMGEPGSTKKRRLERVYGNTRCVCPANGDLGILDLEGDRVPERSYANNFDKRSWQNAQLPETV